MNREELDRTMNLAAEVFALHGFSGAGMRELSARCGVSAPTIYHYFGSKEQLFEAVCADKYRRAIEHVRAAIKPATAVDQQIQDLCACLFDLLINDRVLFLLLRRDLIDGSISGDGLRSRHQYQGMNALLKDVLTPRFDTTTAQRLAFTVSALIFGYCEMVHVGLEADLDMDTDALPDKKAELIEVVSTIVAAPLGTSAGLRPHR